LNASVTVSALPHLVAAACVLAVLASVVHAVAGREGSFWAALGAMVLAILAAVGSTGLAIFVAFAEVPGAAEKQARLDEAIDVASRCTFYGMGALVVWLPGFLVGSRKRSRRANQTR
jgi:hypothetical protein